MGPIPFTSLPMDRDAATLPAGGETFPTAPPPLFPATTTTTDGSAAAVVSAAMNYLNSQLYAPSLVQPLTTTRQQLQQQSAGVVIQPAAEAKARRQEEIDALSITFVHLLITCTGAIQAGDYSVAHGNLSEAHAILTSRAIPTSSGIGRVGAHFADALAQRLFPAPYPPPHAASPAAAAATPAATTSPAAYVGFYDAGPYLKFAYATANRAILRAFEGCSRLHVVDFAVSQGIQLVALMDQLARRDGGPPELLRITAVGGRDELKDVGFRLAEFARYAKIPFVFQGVAGDLDGLCDWVHLHRHVLARRGDDEAVAVNSICQLHRLLVDPAGDADSRSSGSPAAAIDVVLDMVVRTLKPRVFTVVEQEADHNRPLLLQRFTNALFHYATMFDSLEAMAAMRGGGGGGSTTTATTRELAEAYLRGEIFDIICGEGSARTERHDRFSGGWKERLAGAGFTQVEFDRGEADLAFADLVGATGSVSGGGFTILQGNGGIALAWHGRPLYVASAWHAMGGGGDGGSSSNGNRGRGRGRRGGGVPGIIFL